MSHGFPEDADGAYRDALERERLYRKARSMMDVQNEQRQTRGSHGA